MTYDFIMEAIDKVVRSFEDGTESNLILRTKLSPASTEGNEITLYIENEVETLLDGLNVQNNVEVITEDFSWEDKGVLCVSFFYQGNLGTYNVFVYDY